MEFLLVGVAILVIQQTEGHVLQPIVLGRAVRLHPVVVIVALAAGTIVAGIAGAFLAVPLTAVTVTVTSYVRSLREVTPGAAEQEPEPEPEPLPP